MLLGMFRRRASGGGGGPTDPLWASVASLLAFNGSDGSTSMVDARSPTWTAAGDAQLSNAQSLSGGTSLRTQTTGTVISSSGNALGDFGTGDFCIECWVRFSDTGVNRVLWSRDNGFSVFGSNTSLVLYSGSSSLITASSAISTGTWIHVAVSRDSGTVRLFVNGVSAGSATFSSSMGASELRLSRYGPSASSFFNGYMEDFRVTKGQARYTSNFTPPTSPLPTA